MLANKAIAAYQQFRRQQSLHLVLASAWWPFTCLRRNPLCGCSLKSRF